MKQMIIFLCLSMACAGVHAQQQTSPWTLEECVNYAQENNLNLALSYLDQRAANTEARRTRHSRWPSLSASSNFGYNFGRTIDPTSNEFITTGLGFNSISVNSGVTLFNYNRINNSIRQAGIDQQVAELNYEQSELDLSLQIANLYLNSLLAKENEKIAETQYKNVENQLDRTSRLVRSGAQPKAAEYELRAELAAQRQQWVDAENNAYLALLQLKQALQLEIDAPFDIEAPPTDVNIENTEVKSVTEIFERSLATQPVYRAAEMNVQSASLGRKIAQAAFFPSLSLGLNVNSNYSTQGRFLDGTELQTQRVPAQFQGEMGELTFLTANPIFSTPGWLEQMDNNLGFGFALQLGIPIYSNYNNRANVQQAKIQRLRAERQLDLQEQTIRIDVERAVTDLRAASKSYEASQSAFEAAQIAFENTQKQFDLGSASAFDFFQSQQRLQSAQLQMTVAKYDYIFRQKIVDFYLGNPIKL
jgi:outer membrane protein